MQVVNNFAFFGRQIGAGKSFFKCNKTSSRLVQKMDYSRSFKFQDLEDKSNVSKRKLPDMSNLKFGHCFSDNMLNIDWSLENGWGKPVIEPIRRLRLHPAAKCLHYSTQCFEGFKAHYSEGTRTINIFRPMIHIYRFKKSANYVCLPDFDGDEFLKCLIKLIEIDKKWVPRESPSSLYIRPTFIGTGVSLGVSITKSAKLYVITGPVSSYYSTGKDPITLYANTSDTRTWEGGSGIYKIVKPLKEAIEKHGAQQVLWLYGKNHILTEVGTMNLFIYCRDINGVKQLVTPCTSRGVILPGVIRNSIIDIAKSLNVHVVEKEMTMNQLCSALDENRVIEMFGTGTACTVAPIGKIKYEQRTLNIPHSHKDIISSLLYKKLTDIQFGKDDKEYNVKVCNV